MMRTNQTSSQRGRRPAFTIVELMVVVGIIVLLISVAVPSFNAMTYSTTRSLAENSLRRSVTVARDIALRSSQGGDGAIVFVFDPGGQMRIVPAEQVGTFKDEVPDEFGQNGVGGINEPPFNGFFGQFINRDVFVPSGLAESIALPANWNVRGFAPGGMMLDSLNSGSEIAEWYNSDLYGGTDTGSLTKVQGNWVFPETGFYDRREAVSDGGATGRQSFMVRFDAQTGALSSSRSSAVLVDPRPSEADRGAYNPTARDAWTRVDKADSLRVWASRAIQDANPDANASFYNDEDFRERSRLIGSQSNDTILVRPVSRLALADERRLAAGIGANGLNQQTQSLYHPYTERRPEIGLDESLFRAGFDPDIIRQNINAWISGDTNGGPGAERGGRPDQLIGDGEVNFDPDDGVPDDQPQASLFSLSPYTGELLELDP
ncbi:MAG: hypothetical protein RIB60_04485 [Phycisphaerales bacterium]